MRGYKIEVIAWENFEQNFITLQVLPAQIETGSHCSKNKLHTTGQQPALQKGSLRRSQEVLYQILRNYVNSRPPSSHWKIAEDYPVQRFPVINVTEPGGGGGGV